MSPDPSIYTDRHPKTDKHPHRREWRDSVRPHYFGEPEKLADHAGITIEQATCWLAGDGGPSPVQLAQLQSRLARGGA